jgi:hypothetical protein
MRDRRGQTAQHEEASTAQHEKAKTPDTQITPIRRGNVNLAWPEKDFKTQEGHQQIVELFISSCTAETGAMH